MGRIRKISPYFNVSNNINIVPNYNYFFFNNIFKRKIFSAIYLRNFFGIVGSAIIILNENKIPAVEEKQSKAFEIFIGVLCNFLSMITGGIEGVCNKIMAKEKTPITSQMFYVGCSHIFYSFFGC